MISVGLQCNGDTVLQRMEILQRMILVRQQVVARHRLVAWFRSEIVGLKKAAALVERLMGIAELRALVEVPVLAMMLCTEGEAVLQEIGKARTLQALSRGVIYQMVVQARITRELQARLKKPNPEEDKDKANKAEEKEKEKASNSVEGTSKEKSDSEDDDNHEDETGEKVNASVDGKAEEGKPAEDITPAVPIDVSAELSLAVWCCQMMALEMASRRGTHLPMGEVRDLFLRVLRAGCPLLGAAISPPAPGSPEERGLVDALLLCAPMRVGRLREMGATVSFAHLSLQEFFAAQALVASPGLLSRPPCDGRLDLPSLPAVRGFARDLAAVLSPEARAALEQGLKKVVERTKGDPIAEGDTLDVLWSDTPEGKACPVPFSANDRVRNYIGSTEPPKDCSSSKAKSFQNWSRSLFSGCISSLAVPRLCECDVSVGGL